MFKINYLKRALLASYITLGLLSAQAQNNPDLPAKGQIKPVITLPDPGIGAGTSLYESGGFSTWELNGFKRAENGLTTKSYKSNSSLSATGNTVKIPVLKGDEQVYIKITDQFSIESSYDFGQILVSENAGSSWSPVYRVSGSSAKRTAWINVSAFAGKTIQLALSFKSDASFESTGWFIHELSITKGNSASSTNNQRIESANAINVTGVNTSNFPQYVYVDFEYTINGVQQPNALTLKDIDLDAIIPGATPQNDNGGCAPRLYGPDITKRQLDIMFLIDNSGSMSDKQAQVISNIITFTNDLKGSNDVAYGMLRFGQSSPLENLEVLPGTLGLPTDNFTTEVPYYQGELVVRNTTNGGTERGYEALELGLTANFRPTAQKIFILITDENVTDPSNMGPTTKSKVITDLKAKNVIVYAWIPNDTDYNATYADVATQTGGLRYDIYSPITGLETIIANAAKGTYTLRYCPAYTTLDATVHSSKITLKSDPTAYDSKTWVATPNKEYILRDAATTLQESTMMPKNAVGKQLCFDIYDNAGPFPASAQVFIKPISASGSYTSVTMTQGTAAPGFVQKWCGTIPSALVLDPGFAYYAVATYPDAHQLKSPPTKEAFFAWNQAVDPNAPPVITILGSTPTTVTTCSNTNVIFTVSDATANYNNVTFYSREAGSLSGYTPLVIDLGPSGTATSGTYTIPVSITGTGLEYYITATDSYGITSTKGDPNNPVKITTTAITPANSVSNRMTLYFNNTVRLQCTALKVGDVLVAWYTDACGNEAIGGKTTVADATLSRQTLYAYGNTLATGKNGFAASEGIQLYILRSGKRFDIEFTQANPYPPYTAGGILTASGVSYSPSVTFTPRFGTVAIPFGDITPSASEGTLFNVNYLQSLTRSYTMNVSGCGGVSYYGITSSDANFDVVMTDYTTGAFTITYNANAPSKGTITILSSLVDYIFDVEGNPITCTKAVNYGSVLVADGDITPSLTEGTDFGTTATAVTRPFVLSGTGCSPALAITAVNSSNPTDFTVTNSGNNISVKYNAVSDASAVITITTNSGPYTFTVVGKRPACITILKYGAVSINNLDSSPSVAEGTDFGITQNPITRSFTLNGTGCTPIISAVSSSDPAFTYTYSGATVNVTYNASIDAVGTITLTTNNGPYSFDVVGAKAANCAIRDVPVSNIIQQNGAQVKIKMNVNTAPGSTVGVSGQFINLSSGSVLNTYSTANYSIYYPYWENYVGGGTTLAPGTYRLRLVVTDNGSCNGIFNYDFVVQ